MDTTAQTQSPAPVQAYGTQFNPLSQLASLVQGDGFTVVGDYRSTVPSMVGAIRVTKERDDDSWERHEQGDEVLVVLSGEVTMTLRSPSGRAEEHKLSRGDVLIIPRGVAHRGVTRTDAAEILFVTPSTGTQEWREG